MKKKKQKYNSKKKAASFRNQWGKGMDGLAIVFFIVIGASLFLSGFLYQSEPIEQVSVTGLGLCCDTGNGDNCKPQTSSGKTLQFTSPSSITYPQYKNVAVQYGLLKSNAKINKCLKHGIYNGQTITYPDGKTYPIIYNASEHLSGSTGPITECPNKGFDQIGDERSGQRVCFEIPDDSLVYVCKENCEPPFGTGQKDNSCDPNAPVYGNPETVYDIYHRLNDYPVPGVPDVIKNCNTLSGAPTQSAVVTTQPSNMLFSPFPEHKTLQLHTMDFAKEGGGILMPNPYCKPAVYLYPEKKQTISVKLNPKGPITYTDPVYPKTGWQVIAESNGNIYDKNTLYDYLYYEAEIPDTLIPKMTTGYAVAYAELASFFATLLPQLGLNVKEQQQFVDYWLEALPQSSYYKITLIPQHVIDDISPLTIHPKPDAVLRVTLHFEPLEKSIQIQPPALASFTRKGFTVVEWAGMYKVDKDHPFTCLQ